MMVWLSSILDWLGRLHVLGEEYVQFEKCVTFLQLLSANVLIACYVQGQQI